MYGVIHFWVQGKNCKHLQRGITDSHWGLTLSHKPPRTHSEPGRAIASLGSQRWRTIQELNGGEPFRNSMVEDLHHALPVEPSGSRGARSKSLGRLCLTFSLTLRKFTVISLHSSEVRNYQMPDCKHCYFINAWKPFRNSFPGVTPSRRAERNQRTKQLQGTYWKLRN